MKVKEIMSSPVETINFDATILAAAKKMKSFDIGILPVMRKDKIAGMITDRDIVIRIIAEKLDPQQTQVNRGMTPETVCCREDSEIEEAAKMMEDKKVHRLLVLDSNKNVCGILSVSDLACKMKNEHMVYEVMERICEPA